MRSETEIRERIKELEHSLEDVKPYGDDYFEIRRCLNELKWVLDEQE